MIRSDWRMLTAASLCFGKTALPHPFGSKASLRLCPIPTDKAPLRLCLPHREIDIIVPIVFIVSIVFIVFIVFIVSIITIPPILAIASFPAILAIPPFTAIGGLFRLTPFRFSLRHKPIRFFRADTFPFLSG